MNDSLLHSEPLTTKSEEKELENDKTDLNYHKITISFSKPIIMIRNIDRILEIWDIENDSTYFYWKDFPVWTQASPSMRLLPDFQLFIYGGIAQNNEICNKAYMADIKKKTIKKLQNGRKRCCGSCVELGGFIYVFGGLKTSEKMTNKCDRYNIVDNSWSKIKSLPEATRWTLAEPFGNEILVTGIKLKWLYVYSVLKSEYYQVLKVIKFQYKFLFVNNGKGYLLCEDGNIYESEKYNIRVWSIVGSGGWLGLIYPQYYQKNNFIYFCDVGYVRYQFNLDTKTYNKLNDLY